MVKFSVSNVAYVGPNFGKLSQLPLDVGIEIFYEWGGARFYELALRELLRDRTGAFSIHAPFQYIDFSAPCDEAQLFEYLMEPFELYHRFDAKGYVIHTDAPQRQPLPEAEAQDRRKRVADRLCRFDALARREGVMLLVENLCVGASGFHLFDAEQYLNLLQEHPQLDCLIDMGHAHLQKLDILLAQSMLGERIKGYHLHDNDGISDSHAPAFAGGIDWIQFAAGVRRHTPDAQLVFEYGSPEGVPGLAHDIKRFQEILSGSALN